MLTKKLIAGAAPLCAPADNAAVRTRSFHPRAVPVGALALAAAGSLIAYSAAFAQTTASQVAEVEVTAHPELATGGLAVQVQTPKVQSVIDHTYIQHEPGSANFGQLTNLLPGVSFLTEDPTGILSSDGGNSFRIHGFDGGHVSFTIDGTPINDTGNYAVYPGEYLTNETIDHITVNQGQTEVDSPTASAIGGTVNIVMRTPPHDLGGMLSVSGGSYDYRRAYGEFDTGDINSSGLRAFFSANYAEANKYKGEGVVERAGVDGRIIQPLNGDDFISLAYDYAQDRPYFYYSSTVAQYGQFGRSLDYNTQWAVPTATPGAPDSIIPAKPAAPGFEQGNDSNFWRLHPNPVNWGDVRMQSQFHITPKLILTFDPYFFYTLANGGGTTSLNETDPRLVGSATAPPCANGGSGVDLNGDGDCKDTVLEYSPSDTQTYREGINTSLLYDIDEHNHLQLSYAFDYGHHRQTGLFTTINQQNGDYANVFGGLQGPQVDSVDGVPLRTRDRLSIAMLNQVSFNYIGKFLDDKLHVNIGLRMPFFQRDLNQYCYTYNGTSAWCDSVSNSAVQAAYNADVAAYHTGLTTASFLSHLLGPSIKYNPSTHLPNFRFPFNQTYRFSRPLPNLGASYNIDDSNQVYASFTEGFSAPKTDDLYTSEPSTVKPETSYQYAAGYRYQSSTLTVSTDVWGANWLNHIVQSYDPIDPSLSIDRNVGDALLYGWDIEAGWKPIPQLLFYVSGTLMHSQLQNDYLVAPNTGPDVGIASVPLPVKGKELVNTPNQMAAFRVQYHEGLFTVAIQGKYTGSFYLSDTNDFKMSGFTTVDLDAEMKIPHIGKDTEIQLNVSNIFNTRYYVRGNTNGNYTDVIVPSVTQLGSTDKIYAAGGPYLYTGAPATVYVTLKTRW